MRVALIASLALASVLQPLRADPVFYSSRANADQFLGLDGVDRIIIECYCQSYSVVRYSKSKALHLSIRGSYDIQGYHGSPEQAGAHPLERGSLMFRVERTANTLVLRSRERTYIHHALLVEALMIEAPFGPTLDVHQISADELEGRGG